MRLSFILMPLLSLTRAYSYDSESSEVAEEASDSQLRCFITNTTTGSVTLETCGNPNMETRFVPKPQPACMMVRTRKGKTVRSCVVLHAVAAAACDPRACVENRKTYFSSCCCLTSGCNENMLPRPEH